MKHPLNQSEALRIINQATTEQVEAQLAKSKEIIDWSKLPTTQKILKELEEKEESFKKEVLNGRCGDITDYKAAILSIKKVKGAKDIIEKHQKVYDRIIEARKKQIEGGQ